MGEILHDVFEDRIAVHRKSDERFGPKATRRALKVIGTGMFDAVIDCHMGYEGTFMAIAVLFFFAGGHEEYKEKCRRLGRKY